MKTNEDMHRYNLKYMFVFNINGFTVILGFLFVCIVSFGEKQRNSSNNSRVISGPVYTTTIQ